MINVTKTYLPDIDKYKAYIDQIFASNWITNNGPLVRELEKRLEDYLEVPYVVLTNNATIALHVAYKLLGIEGEVITTPFSFVATTSSLVWENLKPIYSDIDPATFNLDASQIESKITDRTSCIVPVHVFGNPCEVNAIQAIADERGLKVIYDAAHAFGTYMNNKSVLNYGDVSIVSLHATKVFHAIEGGALILKDEALYKKAKQMINFGLNSSGVPDMLGINAKMNEFQAAMGLCVLDDIDQIAKGRKHVYETYMKHLEGINGIEYQVFHAEATRNYSYFPILLRDQYRVLQVKSALERNQIFTRRYFFPSLETLAYIESGEPMMNSRQITERVLCLPMYHGLPDETIKLICNIVTQELQMNIADVV